MVAAVIVAAQQRADVCHRPFKAATSGVPRRAARCSAAPPRAQQGPAAAAAAAACAAPALLAASPALAAANEALAPLADGASLSLAVGGGAAVAGLAAALVLTDPGRRRSAQMQETGGDELEAVKKYFDTAGFERWNKVGGARAAGGAPRRRLARARCPRRPLACLLQIYGETDEVNKVQLDIRQGHAQVCPPPATRRHGRARQGRPPSPTADRAMACAPAPLPPTPGLQTVAKVLRWLEEEGGVQGDSVCDAGCGTGSLAIPLALAGAAVSASDIRRECVCVCVCVGGWLGCGGGRCLVQLAGRRPPTVGAVAGGDLGAALVAHPPDPPF